jgi:hypothetical protein
MSTPLPFHDRAMRNHSDSHSNSDSGCESASFPSAGGAKDDRPGRQPGFPRPKGRSPSGAAESLKLPATRFPFEASWLRGFAAFPVPSFREGKRLNKPPSLKAAKGRAMESHLYILHFTPYHALHDIQLLTT